MKLSKRVAEEIRYKLEILANDDDLLNDYGVSRKQVEAVIESVKEGEWSMPNDLMLEVVYEEMKDHALVLQSNREFKLASLILKTIGA